MKGKKDGKGGGGVGGGTNEKKELEHHGNICLLTILQAVQPVARTAVDTAYVLSGLTSRGSLLTEAACPVRGTAAMHRQHFVVCCAGLAAFEFLDAAHTLGLPATQTISPAVGAMPTHQQIATALGSQRAQTVRIICCCCCC